jgi:hypothetical protein
MLPDIYIYNPSSGLDDGSVTPAKLASTVYGLVGEIQPLGTVSAGSSVRLARADHVHPTDTSRAPAASPTFSGTITTPFSTGIVHSDASGVLSSSAIVNADVSASAAIAVSKLAASSVTVNGTAITLGGSGTVKASTTNALTISTGLSGTSFDGSSAVTIANTGVLSVNGSTGAVTNIATTGANTFTSTQTVTPSTSVTGITVNAAASSIGAIVKANATTPGNLQQWQDSSSNVITRVVSGGGIIAVEPIVSTTAGAGTTTTLDCSTGTTFTVTFGAGNITGLLLTNLPNAGSTTITLILKQDASAGSRTITWSGTTINGSATNAVPKWASGTAPTLSTAINSVDIVTLVVNRTSGATDNVYGFLAGKAFA